MHSKVLQDNTKDITEVRSSRCKGWGCFLNIAESSLLNGKRLTVGKKELCYNKGKHISTLKRKKPKTCISEYLFDKQLHLLMYLLFDGICIFV